MATFVFILLKEKEMKMGNRKHVKRKHLEQNLGSMCNIY